MTQAATFQQPDQAAYNRPALTGPAGVLAGNVVELVKRSAAHAPRSLQAAVGPSEIGTPCVRRLAYKLLDHAPKPNTDTDPWASIIGTDVHAGMADKYAAENRRLGRQRYLIEHRVHLPGGISGSSDLYDRDDLINNDWKVTGLDRIKKYRKAGPGQQYRVQAHLYGLGMLLAGETPKDVAITFLPRGGRITDLYVWSEPFDPQVAVEALQRLDATRETLAYLDPGTNPDRWALLPTGDAYCTYCPWHLPGSTDLGSGCPGHTK